MKPKGIDAPFAVEMKEKLNRKKGLEGVVDRLRDYTDAMGSSLEDAQYSLNMAEAGLQQLRGLISEIREIYKNGLE